ncbi:hypothetical protein [Ruegeria lacuscaerulensis]|uniref:hypothetical protein n=1 Tax=Ruegeria lacuscaerulensis TaxID=55218 RepID=UPI00147CC780|nr:hypothetical protein [Ruegeria lacuscaerulensis]
MTHARIINHIAFPLLVLAAILGIYWIWGLMFLWWVVPSVMAGKAYLVFEVSRDEDPILFWLVVGLWATFGCMMIVASLLPGYAAWLV